MACMCIVAEHTGAKIFMKLHLFSYPPELSWYILLKLMFDEMSQIFLTLYIQRETVRICQIFEAFFKKHKHYKFKNIF